jgi:hypothetical protein
VLIVEQVFLVSLFTECEIKKIVFSCDPKKASASDDFLFQFYQFFFGT